MNKRLIAISTGDWHIHNWNQFNKGGRRLKVNIQMVKDFFILSHTKKVPILFTGDLFHTPNGLSNKLFDLITAVFTECFEKYPDAMFYAISGNHDLSEVNSKEHRSPSYIVSLSRMFPRFRCWDFQSSSPKSLKPIVLYGVPYIDHNIGFEKILDEFPYWDDTKRILLIHTNLYGAVDPNGYEAETENIPRNMSKFFKKFDLVLSGHIHQNKEVADGIVMVGAPCQQRKSDMGCEMGYLEIYDDLDIKFVKTNYPEFREYPAGEDIPDDFHYWLPKVEKTKKQKSETKEFSTDLTRKEIVNRYLQAKGIDSNIKRKALVNLLNSVE